MLSNLQNTVRIQRVNLALVEHESHQQPAKYSPEPVAGAYPCRCVLAYIEQPVF